MKSKGKNRQMSTSLDIFKPKIRPGLRARKEKSVELVVRIKFYFKLSDFFKKSDNGLCYSTYHQYFSSLLNCKTPLVHSESNGMAYSN